MNINMIFYLKYFKIFNFIKTVKQIICFEYYEKNVLDINKYWKQKIFFKNQIILLNYNFLLVENFIKNNAL